MENRKANLMMIGAMLIFGTIGLVRRMIPLGSAAVASFRGLCGALVILLYCLCRHRKPLFECEMKHLALLFLSGAMIGGNWILLFESYAHASIAVSTICYYTAPIMAVLFAAILFREKPKKTDTVSIIIAAVGMLLISGIFSSAQTDSLGIVFGLSAALLYACIMLINRRLTSVEPFTKTFIQMLAAGIATLPYALLAEHNDFSLLGTKAILMLLIAGIVHTGIAYLLYFSSISRLSVAASSMYGYIDPASAILLSCVILHEAIAPPEWIGIALILFSVIYREVNELKRS